MKEYCRALLIEYGVDSCLYAKKVALMDDNFLDTSNIIFDIDNKTTGNDVMDIFNNISRMKFICVTTLLINTVVLIKVDNIRSIQIVDVDYDDYRCICTEFDEYGNATPIGEE